MFKHFVQRVWASGGGDAARLPAPERARIKQVLVDTLVAMPGDVQKQLSDALSHIAASDFPTAWPELLPSLRSRIDSSLAAAPPAFAALGAAIAVAAAVFQPLSRGTSTADRVAHKAALDGFAQPLTLVFRSLDAELSAATRSTAAGVGSIPAWLLPSITTCVSVFWLMNKHGLPEFFEANLEEWMLAFHRYLKLGGMPERDTDAMDLASSRNLFAAPRVVAPPSTSPAAGDELRTAVLECMVLFANEYPAEFEPFFSTAVQSVSQLLTSTPRQRMLSANLDPLVIQALRFLCSAVSGVTHAAEFQNEATLRAMLTNIVLPNLELKGDRLTDFFDNGAEFVKWEVDGSDADVDRPHTRRRVAMDLVRALRKSFEAQTSTMCLALVTEKLAQYSAVTRVYEGPYGRQPLKDAALTLLMAVAAPDAQGGTPLNRRFNLPEVFAVHVLPELGLALRSSDMVTAFNIDDTPLVRASCIKFLSVFRDQLQPGEVEMVVPRLVALVASTSFVVHTFAAAAIDRLLLMPPGVLPPTSPASPVALSPRSPIASSPRSPRIALDGVAPHIASLLSTIFVRLSSTSYPLNEHFMRCVLSCVLFTQDKVAPLAPTLVAELTRVLSRVVASPTLSVFTHLMFETYAATLRLTVSTDPNAAAYFETALTPLFSALLEKDVVEFEPYVFQLLAQMLELRPQPALNSGGSALSPWFTSFLPRLLAPTHWARRSTAPALAQLLAAYGRQGAAYLAEQGLLVTYLNRVQACFESPSENADELGYLMLCGLTVGGRSSPAPFVAQLPNILRLLFVKLSSTDRGAATHVAPMFVHWLGVGLGVYGPACMDEALRAVNSVDVYDRVVATMANRITGDVARGEAVYGLVRLLTEHPTLMETPVWGKVLVATVELCEYQPEEIFRAARPSVLSGSNRDVSVDVDAGSITSEGGVEDSAVYTHLHQSVVGCAFPDAPPPKVSLARSLATWARGRAGGGAQLDTMLDASAVGARVRMYARDVGESWK